MTMPYSPEERRQIALTNAELDREEASRRDREMLLASLQAATSPNRQWREPFEVFVHCGNVLDGCDDTQRQVPGFRVTTAQTYRDVGGDNVYGHLVQNSWTEFEVGPDDQECPRCGNRVHVTGEQRPQYATLSGHDPRELIRLAQGWTRSGLRPPAFAGAVFQPAQNPDDRVSALEAQLAELQAKLNAPAVADTSELPKGVRRRGERFEALVYKSESADGKQHSAGTFDTADEAAEARAAALDEIAGAES